MDFGEENYREKPYLSGSKDESAISDAIREIASVNGTSFFLHQPDISLAEKPGILELPSSRPIQVNLY
jgi:hypothetical protein